MDYLFKFNAYDIDVNRVGWYKLFKWVEGYNTRQAPKVNFNIKIVYLWNSFYAPMNMTYLKDRRYWNGIVVCF